MLINVDDPMRNLVLNACFYSVVLLTLGAMPASRAAPCDEATKNHEQPRPEPEDDRPWPNRPPIARSPTP